MEILYLLVPLSILLVLGVGALFWWSLQSGQFDDLDTPADLIFNEPDESTAAGAMQSGPNPPPV